MNLSRWAAGIVVAGTLAIFTQGGCKTTPDQPENANPPRASADATAALRDQYARTGAVVGQVEAVDDQLAAISGIDPAAVGADDALIYVDPASDKYINGGNKRGVTGSGRIVASYRPDATRPPQVGDLVLRSRK